MKKFVNKKVLFAVGAFITVWIITAGVAYGATVFQKSLNASVRVVAGEAEFEFYSNQAATQAITQVSLPDVSPGGTSTFTVYVKNTGPASETIFAGTNTVPTSVGTLTLTFDGVSQKTLAPGAVARVVGTLRASDDANDGPINFTLSVSASATGTGSNPTPTGTALSGQQLLNTYCITCHSSGPPNTNRTQSQLVSFISNHETGSNLTAEEVAALATFVNQ